MYNSPINRLFGTTAVGQDGGKQQGKQEKEDSKNEQKNLFEENTELYTDISSETFDIEEFINKFFRQIMSNEQSERTLVKIEDFLYGFDLSDFKQKYGENLSKEDLSVILYSLAEKFGAKF